MIELRVMPNDYGVASAPLIPASILSGTWMAPTANYSGPEGAMEVQVRTVTPSIPRPMGTLGSREQDSSRPRFLLFKHLSGSIPTDQAEAITRAVREVCEQEDHEE